jgi:hypothetical protein
MGGEPVAGQLGGACQGPRLLEQMCGTLNDAEVRFAPHLLSGLAVEAENDGVLAADDESGGRTHGPEAGTGEIRPATSGHDRRDVSLGRRGSSKCGGRTGAGAEKSKWQLFRRSNSRVAMLASLSTDATYRLRELCRLLPLPCAKTTSPIGSSGTYR